MKSLLLAILALFLGAAFLIFVATSIHAMNESEQAKNKSNVDAEYLQWALKYFVDTRTNLCFAKTAINTLTNVPCSPEVLKLAIPIK